MVNRINTTRTQTETDDRELQTAVLSKSPSLATTENPSVRSLESSLSSTDSLCNKNSNNNNEIDVNSIDEDSVSWFDSTDESSSVTSSASATMGYDSTVINSTTTSSASRIQHKTTTTTTTGDSVVNVPNTFADKYSHKVELNGKQEEDDEEEELNLNLGQTWIDPENAPCIRFAFEWLDRIFFVPWQSIVFALWKMIPQGVRRFVLLFLWKNVYLPLHKAVLGRSTGIHVDASFEYHALTTLVWWLRFLPMTVSRIRFSISELTTIHPHPILSNHQPIQVDMTQHLQENQINIPPDQKQHCTVRGLWIQSGSRSSNHVLFWILGGAYVAAPVEGNLGPAEYVGRNCNMDVFVVQHREVPDTGTLQDITWDVFLAYRWLVQHRDPSSIVIAGSSSGGGLAVRLLQAIAARQQQGNSVRDFVPSFVTPLVPRQQPRCAVLYGPLLDVTEPSRDSVMWRYARHDLVVSTRVAELLSPFLRTHTNQCPHEQSALNGSMEGLPPLCVIVSKHENIYQQAYRFVRAARQANVPVTMAEWKYVCHLFTFMSGLLPEGQESLDYSVRYIQQQLLLSQEQDQQARSNTQRP